MSFSEDTDVIKLDRALEEARQLRMELTQQPEATAPEQARAIPQPHGPAEPGQAG